MLVLPKRKRLSIASSIAGSTLPADLTTTPTGRDLVILGLPLAVKLRGRRQWLEWGIVSGVVAGAPFAAINVEISAKIPTGWVVLD
jgi:hypothetical protein